MTAGEARFALRMAWRETRGAWRHFAVLFACVALGVAALVAVGSLAAALERTLAREAKALLGGDVELRASRALDADARAALAALRARGATVLEAHELVGMARDAGARRSSLVELRAVGVGYPLYGRLLTRPAAPLERLLDGGGAVVHEDLLARLGVRVGDPIAIGAGTFTVRGTLAGEPDRPASLVTLGPRVLIGADALAATGLVQPGSRVRHRALVRLPEGLAAREVAEDLTRRLGDPGLRVTAYDAAQPGFRKFFADLTTYLGLVGLASLLVGGIGVASSVTTFLRRHVTSIAVLKCLGAEGRTVVATYLAQALGVGVAASVAGALAGAALQPALAAALAGVVPFALDVRLEPGTIARGVAMGALTTLLCALWPLLEARAVRPSLLLRREVAGRPPEAARPWLAALPVAAGLAGLVLWQAGSLKIAGIFLGASAGALVLLLGLGRALVVLARRLPRLPWPAWRQGLAGLTRPGGQAARVVVALGAAVMLLVAVALLEASLAARIDHEQRREAPSFFFVDVQAGQRDEFLRLVREVGGDAAPALTAVVRARLAAVDGAPVTRALVEQRAAGRDTGWYYTRDYILTQAAALPAGNVITRGQWFNGAPADGRARISVEEGAARALGVDLGDRLLFDVQGVAVEAEVQSVRRVDWQSLTTNFFVIFSPGALDGAPATYVATARVPPAAERRLQDRVVAALPNVTAIPVREVLERVAAVLDRMATAIRLIALFTLATGVVVMAGALAATRYQRLYESVILRTLGATRGAVARTFAVEYAALGTAAGLGGSALAALLAWVVTRFVLDTPWTVEPRALLLGVVLSALLAVGVGFLATFRLLGARPLAVLRQE